MAYSKSLVLALAAVLFASAVSARVYNVFESTSHVPRGWTLVGPTTTNERLQFKVAMNPRNMDVLKAALYKVSDPTNPEYGQWWTGNQISELISPPREEQELVQNWLSTFNFEYSLHGDYFIVEGDMHEVERALSTKFYTFRHTEKNGATVDRAMEYTVPAFLDNVVKMVSGLTGFPTTDAHRHLKVRTVSNKRDDSKGKVCPEVIWQLYNMAYTPETHFYNSSLCLVAYTNLPAYRDTDLKVFEDNTLLPEVTPDHIVGRFFSTIPLDESTLDVEYGIGISENTSTWFWTSSGWLYDFNTDFLATDPVPFVVSMSYGYPEDGQCDIGDCNGMTNEQYTNTVNDQYLQMTMRGVTIVVSSGDQGAQGDFNDKCDNKNEVLSSSFPGASEYVLSIGATMLNDPSPKDPPTTFHSPFCQTSDCSTSRTEKPCSYPDALITTGGGFSIYLDQPDYQKKEVTAYLNSGVPLPAARDYDPTKRAYPDVSAVGHNFYIQYIGASVLVDGTSCSAPVWGGILTRMNASRMAKGKSSLGFVNPLFYSLFESDPSYFNDITVGNNNCTESCCGVGFTSSKGWDPVTGLGTPNYQKILNYVTNILP